MLTASSLLIHFPDMPQVNSYQKEANGKKYFKYVNPLARKYFNGACCLRKFDLCLFYKGR